MEEPSLSDVKVLSRRQLNFCFHGSSLGDEVTQEEDAVQFESDPVILYEDLARTEDLSDPDELSFLDAHEFVEYCGVLIRRVITGNLSREKCLQRLKPHLDAHFGLSSLIVDELQIAEYSAAESEDASATDRYTDLVMQLVSRNVVPLGDVRERLEQEMLLTLGVFDKGSSWDTRYVFQITEICKRFKLQKFNLYREESEGFVELVDVLDQANAVNTNLITEKIMELAGIYDLDIYRIVETILTAICLQPKYLTDVLLEICASVDFDIGSLIAMLGTKFQLHAKKSGKGFRCIRGLCHLVCHIVSEGLSSWEDIIPYVPFTREETELHWKQMFERAIAEGEVLHTNKRSVKEQANNMENVSFESMTQYFEEIRNPRIELVATMMQKGMYHNAVRLINEMPIQYATTFEPVALEISKLIHYVVDPVYQSIGLDAQRIPESDSNFPAVFNDQLPPQLKDSANIAEALDPWLMLLGGNIIYDRVLLSKLLRIVQEFVRVNEVAINQDPKSLSPVSLKLFKEFLHLFEHCFLPALTRGTGSSALSEEIFAVLKMLPYTIRFTLYYKTKVDFYPCGHPLGVVARSVALANAKWFQKRINKDNTKLCGRMAAKDLYNNAIIVCTYLSERIGSYDNFGTLVTEAMRNASAFAADIMLYSVLEYMTMPKNNNHKHDAMTIMPWYRFTATFSAVFAKRITVELEPILEYVVGMLKSGQTVDLLILKELVHKLSGIEVSEGVTDEQLEALAGGEVLKSEGAYFSPMRNTKRSSIRLKDALLKSGQALPLCLLISHVESVILYKEDEGKNLKLVGLLYDMCHDTLVQYGTFLATNLTKAEYAENFPTLAELIRVYNIPFETSIFLLRSVYWNEISSKIEDFKKQEGIPDGTLNEDHFKLVQEKFSKTFESVISSVVDLIAPVMTQAPMEDISLRFYVLFWFLSLYDLYVPTAVYEQEVEKFQQVVVLDKADQGDEDINTVYKRKKEGQRAQIVITRLQEEMSVQKQHVQMLRNHLAEEKDRWFQSAKSNKSDVVSQFLQMCVLPRATFSTIDALFSAHFISSLHELRTQNFSTLLCYDRMLCDITTALTCCSENEASRYGRLLHTVLETIMRWHNSKSIFEAECQHHPGFMTKFRTPTVSSGADVVDHIDYENFRHVCHKWHFKLTKSMVKSLDSDSYVRIRNGLIVLDRILPYYPIISNFYIAIEKRVQTLMESEKVKRPDMYSLAYGYMGRLRSQKASGHLVLEETFHTRAAGPKKPESLKISKNTTKTEDVSMSEPEVSAGNGVPVSSSEKDKDTVKPESKKVDQPVVKTATAPPPKFALKTSVSSKPSEKTASGTNLVSEKVASNSDHSLTIKLKGPKFVESSAVNGAHASHADQSANGMKSKPVNDKLVVAKEQANRVAKRLEKNGIRPEAVGKDSKQPMTPVVPAVFSDPETFMTSLSKKKRPSTDILSKTVKVEKKPLVVSSGKVRVSSKDDRSIIKVEKPAKKTVEALRSPDLKSAVRKAVPHIKEKERSRPESSSQSPASRKSTDRPKTKFTGADDHVLSALSVIMGSGTSDLESRSAEKKDRHKERVSLDAVISDPIPSRKYAASDLRQRITADKPVEKADYKHSLDAEHKTTRTLDVISRRTDDRKKERTSLHQSVHSSRESSREVEKKSEKAHHELSSRLSETTSRPVKRGRESDSAERDRPHRRSSAAH